MIRVVVADDEPLVRAGIALVLSAADDIEVVAEAADGRQAVTEVISRSADVLLLDIQMPGMDGLTALTESRRVAKGTRVIMLTTYGESEYIDRALDAGATGFLLKDSAPEELIRAVRAVAEGEAYLSPSVTSWVIRRGGSTTSGDARVSEARRKVGALTSRERDVLLLLATGLSNGDIGDRLHLSEATVKMYLSRVFEKLGCANRVQAAGIAHRAGLEV